MANENSSGWITAGRERGLDPNWFEQDKERIYDGLDRLGLPKPKIYTFDGSFLNSVYVDELFGKARSRKTGFFVRLIPKDPREDRPYKEKVFSAEGLRRFCLNYDMERYRVNLVEYGELTHTGSIIATDLSTGVPGRCVMEIASCGGHEFFHGKITPTSAEIEIGPRTVRFRGNNIPEEHRMLVLRALRMTGGPKHPFPGYYEFSVWEGNIFFRNYQPPDSVYGSLGLPLPEVRETSKRLRGD